MPPKNAKKMISKSPSDAGNSLAHNLDSAANLNGPHSMSHLEDLIKAAKQGNKKLIDFHADHTKAHLTDLNHDVSNALENSKKASPIAVRTGIKRLEQFKKEASK